MSKQFSLKNVKSGQTKRKKFCKVKSQKDVEGSEAR